MCIHEWGKYSDPINTARDYRVVQARVCSVCGVWQIRAVRAPWNLWFGIDTLIAKVKNNAGT